MAVHHFPLAILAPVDLSHPQRICPGSALNRSGRVFVRHRVGEVVARTGGDDVDVICRAVREPRDNDGDGRRSDAADRRPFVT
jgi:hypothetical protein